MGNSKNIQDTNVEISQFKCGKCEQAFTRDDKINDNWDLWWDTSSDVGITNANDKGFVLNIWVRGITHKNYANDNNRLLFNCPYTENCKECGKKKVVSEMKYNEIYFDWDKETDKGDEFYCDDKCHNAYLEREKQAEVLSNRIKENEKK